MDIGQDGTPWTWPDNAWPTPQQLADWLEVCTRKERVSLCRSMLVSAKTATRCIERDHEGTIYLRDLSAKKSPYSVVCPTCNSDKGTPCRENYCKNGYRDCTYAICNAVRNMPEPHVSRVAKVEGQ